MFPEERKNQFRSAVLLPVFPAVLPAVEYEECKAESGDEEGDEVCGDGGNVRHWFSYELPENFFWWQFPELNSFYFSPVIDGFNLFINYLKCIFVMFQWFGGGSGIMIESINLPSL